MFYDSVDAAPTLLKSVSVQQILYYPSPTIHNVNDLFSAPEDDVKNGTIN
jgi:hypothetical protein